MTCVQCVHETVAHARFCQICGVGLVAQDEGNPVVTAVIMLQIVALLCAAGEAEVAVASLKATRRMAADAMEQAERGGDMLGSGLFFHFLSAMGEAERELLERTQTACSSLQRFDAD